MVRSVDVEIEIKSVNWRTDSGRLMEGTNNTVAGPDNRVLEYKMFVIKYKLSIYHPNLEFHIKV